VDLLDHGHTAAAIFVLRDRRKVASVIALHGFVSNSDRLRRRAASARPMAKGALIVTSVQTAYEALLAGGQIEADPAQAEVVRRLDQLATILAGQQKAGGGFAWLLGRKASRPAGAKGLYIWGSVGRGKTMLMDLFFQNTSVDRKRRAHFHDFMADVHARVHAWRQDLKDGKVKGADPIAPVAEALADEALLLCFDEFAVNDIADAMILGRLFSALWKKGVMIVATSNVDPADLYRNGLNRALFLPFIAELQDKVDVLRLDARQDYRLDKLAGSPVYFAPTDASARKAMDAAWVRMTGGSAAIPAKVIVRTREIVIPAAVRGVARFHFNDLCAKPLGALDFLMVAREFHTVMLDEIPALSLERRNEAKRFITLIDVLYEHRVKLIASAADAPRHLYRAGTGFEIFEFDRTVSRLTEMQSEEYLALPHGRAVDPARASEAGIVDT
jgi:cell division protein ZapE